MIYQSQNQSHGQIYFVVRKHLHHLHPHLILKLHFHNKQLVQLKNRNQLQQIPRQFHKSQQHYHNKMELLQQKQTQILFIQNQTIMFIIAMD